MTTTMNITFFNSRSHKLEVFQPIKPSEVGIYTCGPTVYGYAHLGNLRSYLFADGLRRTLEYLGFATKHVMNITDVGHLTSDADEGEDKVELAAQREGKTAWEIASFYTDAFMTDSAQLGIIKPHIIAKATVHIPEQIALIQTLQSKGYTYQTSDGVYFDTEKFDAYGPMSGQPLEDLLAGARVEANPAKRHPADFALWKLSEHAGDSSEVNSLSSSEESPALPPLGGVKEERGGRSASSTFEESSTDTSKELPARRQMEWASPWGVGFPGWHIECSAMSTKYLGQPFDIHTGGIDHLFPHHTDEIAQSEAAAGVPLANYWLHGEFMTVDGAKMSKSLGNTYTLADVIERGYEPLAFRYLMLGTHYRKPVNFTWESLAGAQQGLNNLRVIVRALPSPALSFPIEGAERLSDQESGTLGSLMSNSLQRFGSRMTDVDEKLEADFCRRIADDLGLPQALALLWEVLRSDRSDTHKATAVTQWDQVFGLALAAELGQREEIPADVETLAAKREQARKSGDYAKADTLRHAIEKSGYTVRDTPDGPVLTAHDHPTEL